MLRHTDAVRRVLWDGSIERRQSMAIVVVVRHAVLQVSEMAAGEVMMWRNAVHWV